MRTSNISIFLCCFHCFLGVWSFFLAPCLGITLDYAEGPQVMPGIEPWSVCARQAHSPCTDSRASASVLKTQLFKTCCKSAFYMWLFLNAPQRKIGGIVNAQKQMATVSVELVKISFSVHMFPSAPLPYLCRHNNFFIVVTANVA